MRERVTSVKVTAFRGVPGSLTIELVDGRSIVIFGDNGTGKSTIADALEWYFTGHLEFLRHEGRQQALRHVAAQNHITTGVEIQTTGPLGGTITYGDNVSPTPVGELGSRETFLLRGRTLAQFVDKSKAEKWKAVAQILGLDAVDQLRLNLQRAKNELQRDHATAVAAMQTAAATLVPRVSAITEEGLFRAIRTKCAEAGVTLPATLDVALEAEWSKSISAPDETSRAIELRSLASSLHAGGPAIDYEAVSRWNAAVAAADPQDRRRLVLFRAAEGYLQETPQDDTCPLCDQAVNAETLGGRIKQVLHSLFEMVGQQEEAEAGMKRVCDTLDAIDRHLGESVTRAAAFGVKLPTPPQSESSVARMSLQRQTPADLAVLKRYSDQTAAWSTAAAVAVEGQLADLATPTQAALIEVGALAADARAWRNARDVATAAEFASQLSERVFAAYQGHQRDYVERILKGISARVAAIYRKLHPGEGLNSIDVEPWTDKGIELAVDFHGIRQKPPHGVLSESHLNSLAIALFLAMAETFNDQLGFLVLDDVVNSFDIEHRGHLAKLLTDEFAGWQLIVLTHDHLFYEQLRKRGRNWSSMEFTSWTYERGPRTARYDAGGMLERAQQCLPDDVTGAAQKGRRALEELLQEICEALEAPVPFRRGFKNDRREAGELFAGLRRELKQSSKPLLKELEPLLNDLEADLAATLNVESHASTGRASSAEVWAALGRVHQLDRRWSCTQCGTRVWHQRTPRAWLCGCGRTHFPPVAEQPQSH